MENLKIGEKIKSKRKELEYTQEELANILYVTKAAVSKWENGESYPDITLLPKIAQLFNITIDELFDYKLEYKPLKIVNEFHFGISLNNVDKEILNHGTVKSCKVARNNGEWDTLIEFISNEDLKNNLQTLINGEFEVKKGFVKDMLSSDNRIEVLKEIEMERVGLINTFINGYDK